MYITKVDMEKFINAEEGEFVQIGVMFNPKFYIDDLDRIEVEMPEQKEPEKEITMSKSQLLAALLKVQGPPGKCWQNEELISELFGDNNDKS